MMKKCTRCKTEKPATEFNFKSKTTGLRQLQCRECTRSLIRSHYNRNRPYYLEKVQTRNLILRDKVLGYILDYLRGHPCIDCNESDPIVLEFDHRGDIPKFRAVSSLIRGRFSLERVVEEINKCDVRCANCHRKRTAKDFKWFKSKGY